MPNTENKPLHLAFYGALVLLGPALGACAAGPRILVQPVSHQAFAPSSLVETLTTAPSTPYTVIAHLNVEGTPNEDRAQILAALTKKAASLGANALLIVREKEQTLAGGPITFNPSGVSYTQQAPQNILHIHAEALHLADSADGTH
jgi:hypothetical protein